jgi:phosphomannomutase
MAPMPIDLDDDRACVLGITDAVVAEYGLAKWAQDFWLMTAGYRDRLDPEDWRSARVPFNAVTVAIMVEARARVLARAVSGPASVHVGGEVRPHTQRFVALAARIYAAHGFTVHLQATGPTTPIWYSSFGVFASGLDGGDNFTASHSPYFKGGWKPIDAEGKQLAAEEPAIVAEVRAIVGERQSIRLAAAAAPEIRRNFDVDEAYAGYQATVLGAEMAADVRAARTKGFHCLATPLGGSMGAASRRIFGRLGIAVGPDGVVDYFMAEENSRFYQVGERDGENFGADPCRPEIYRHVGAREKLVGGEALVVFLWDPDGDRFNVVTTAPASIVERAADLGLEVEPAGDRCVVYFTPNQLYFLLLASRLGALEASGQLRAFDWVLGMSVATGRAIEELAARRGVPTVRVPVGFKNLGGLCATIEDTLGKGTEIVAATGERVAIGPRARVVLLCEESGGACVGSHELLRSERGDRTMLALREKDGLQVSLLTLDLACRLHVQGTSFAERYCAIMAEQEIRYRYTVRKDVSLYDESLIGDALRKAKDEGAAQRDRIVSFFRTLAEDHAAGRLAGDEVLRRLSALATGEARVAFPRLTGARWVGDGTLIDMDGLRLLVRASGTDAVMRYYLDATDRELLAAAGRWAAGLRV